MIIGIIHKGSGLGDQLFSYIATRVKALELGVDFGFVGKEFFKGGTFMPLDWGRNQGGNYHIEEPAGKVVIDDSHRLFVMNKPYYDPEWNFVTDGAVIDGYGAQDERYWENYLPQIRKWLDVQPLELKGDLCIINFRGGEYQAVPELFLPINYWNEAIKKIKHHYPNMHFEVHTDDRILAERFFQNIPIITDIALNWRSIRYAKHLILSNSAFGILPSIMNEEVKEVIAPMYWNRYNIKRWDYPQNYYKKFTYV